MGKKRFIYLPFKRALTSMSEAAAVEWTREEPRRRKRRTRKGKGIPIFEDLRRKRKGK